MRLDLTPAEAVALARALRVTLVELRAMASRTERPAEAHPLWEQETLLEGLLARLEAELRPVTPQWP